MSISCLLHATRLGITTWACAPTGNGTGNLLMQRMKLRQLSHIGQDFSLDLFFFRPLPIPRLGASSYAPARAGTQSKPSVCCLDFRLTPSYVYFAFLTQHPGPTTAGIKTPPPQGFHHTSSSPAPPPTPTCPSKNPTARRSTEEIGGMA